MSDIKSAWEIAQEKAGKLGGLSAEEREAQRQDRCRLVGNGIADKYLSSHDVGILKGELGKHEAADRDLIVMAAVRRLAQTIDLQYPGRLADVSPGIIALKNSEATKKALDDIKVLFEEYAVAQNRESQEIEKAAGEILHQMRVSGSAIGRLNPRAKEEWQAKLNQTALPFNDRLNSLRQELTN